jgi:hypothetical protein
MDRLVRDLDETPAAAQPAPAFTGRRSVAQPSSLRKMYVVAGLALVVALSGVAIWSFSRETAQQVEPPVSQEAPPPVRQPTDQGPAINRDPATTILPSAGQLQAEATRPGDTRPGGVVGTRPAVIAPGAAPRPPEASAPTSQEGAPARRPTVEAAPPALDTSGELNALRDDYDNLSLRGGVIDDALNQLWEEMKPNSPRLDMVTHQRSLRTNLARIKDALADRDVRGARRYLTSAREDLEALERFLNR